jgi:hypothetical protein
MVFIELKMLYFSSFSLIIELNILKARTKDAMQSWTLSTQKKPCIEIKMSTWNKEEESKEKV